MNYDPLSEYLVEETDVRISEPQIKENLRYIQCSLLSLGYSPIGDLFDPSLIEVKKTIDCVFSLLQQRQKDIDFRTGIQERIQKLESEKSMYQQKIEQITDDRNAGFSEAGKAQNKLTQESTKWKKEKEKIQAERDDLKKEITKMIGKENKLAHEMKKKEAAYEKMKEQLRKALGEKDLLIQNHFDAVQPLHSVGPKLVRQVADEEFTGLITKGYDESQNYLLNENQELRLALEMVQKELHLMMEERKAALLSSQSKVPNIKLVQVNSSVFMAPFQSVSEDVVESIVENIRKFKQFMQATSSLA
jgi:synovial sarcoma, X breakpoint 2 interacting protein